VNQQEETMTENPGQCEFCRFETKDLIHLEGKEWVCQVCLDTVPHDWSRGDWEPRLTTLLAAINYSTNVTLAAAKLEEEDDKIERAVCKHPHWESGGIRVNDSTSQTPLARCMSCGVIVTFDKALEIDRASRQVTEAEREKVRVALREIDRLHPNEISPLTFAAILYRMSELVADARVR
jgi:hypothetical protein